MKVTVVGLGYVGSVVAASLAARGTHTVGVDLREDVVNAMNAGVAPLGEPLLEARIAKARALGTLTATTSLADAIAQSELSLVCVGTPPSPDGSLDTRQVLGAFEAIASAASRAGVSHTAVLRSTAPPGLYAALDRALSQQLGAAYGDTFTLGFNPEFLREGSAVHDLEDPPLVVYATAHARAAERLEALYAHQRERLVRTDPAAAELLKLACNSWHAVKVAFANEMARLSGPLGVDARDVMSLLVRDTRLNTSAAYLRPGLPFGGACLTKDVAGLTAHARAHGVSVPMLSGVLASNDAHLQHFVKTVLAYRPRRVAVVGVGFKPGAPDVRDSAPVRMVRALLDAGVHVSVADAAILASTVPPLGIDALRAAVADGRADAAPSVGDAVRGADVVVAAHPCEEDIRALAGLATSAPVLDAAGEYARALAKLDLQPKEHPAQLLGGGVAIRSATDWRVLIVPTHPGVQYHFCRVGLPTLFFGNWDQFQYWRPRPDNVRNAVARFDDAQLEWQPDDFARMLDARDPVDLARDTDLAWLMFNWQYKLFRDRSDVPKLYRVAKTQELSHEEWQDLLGREDFTVASFYPNTVAQLKERYGVDVPYIPLGLDAEAYRGWTGEQRQVLSVIHSYRERGWHYAQYTEAMQGLDALHVDHLDPSKPVLRYDDVRRAMRNARVYLHDGEQEYTITLLEAMMTGMPLVSFALPGIERYVVHGVNGFVGRTAREIREYCQTLLHDDALAERMGAQSRAMALRDYEESRWRRDWIRVIDRFLRGRFASRAAT